MAYNVTGTAEANERGAGRADIYIYIHARARIHKREGTTFTGRSSRLLILFKQWGIKKIITRGWGGGGVLYSHIHVSVHAHA